MTQERLSGLIDEFIEKNRVEFKEDLARLISVSSAEGKPEPGAPFGRGPREALEVCLRTASKFGLETDGGDGYVGWAELSPGGTDNGHIAIITHVDIVPEGDGWNSDPFILTEKDGWLIGRGIKDDKGPAMASVYIAKFFREHADKLPLRYGLRVLFGTNEESGMGDVDYYNHRQPAPLFCFSPDSSFPVCNGEKGNFRCEVVFRDISGNIAEFSTGIARNVIPGSAECVVKAVGTPLKNTDLVTAETMPGGLIKLTSAGIAGHAAMPEGTLNAIGILIEYLLNNNLCSESEENALSLFRRIHSSAWGEGLGIECSDEMFGGLTINGGVVSLSGGVLKQSIDIRFPTSTSGEKILSALESAAAEFGASIEEASTAAPFYIPADDSGIASLTDAYELVTGRTGKPFTMGGGTYARHFKKAVAFGPANEDEPVPDFAGGEHAANEAISEKTLFEALRVYITAVWNLQKSDL